ncbi:MAG: hypothetical protein Q9220_005485 [cf. Caloplaca sp. 1 TL-2023]
MRLLQTTEYILYEFHGRRIPPYVILSHTWEQEEISFEDIQNPDCTSLAGYDKIVRCCKLAASNGWEYVWIDTCCIDKRSSAELSEAINSMFRWYQEAQVCYTYLSDVLTAFASSGDIVPKAFSALPRSGLYTVTNRGLAFENMALLPTPGRHDLFRHAETTMEWLAPLNCARLADESIPISLTLRASSEDGNAMMRVLPWDLQTLKLDQCSDGFSYRTVYIKPIFTPSTLSHLNSSQSLLLRFIAVDKAKWGIICVYNGDIPTECWWKGWNMKLHSGDLPDVLQPISSSGENFYLVLKHGQAAPQIDLLMPEADPDDPKGSSPSLASIFENYRDTHEATGATANKYCQILPSKRHRVVVLLSKQCVDGQVRFVLDVSVKSLDDVQTTTYWKFEENEESLQGGVKNLESGSEHFGESEPDDVVESRTEDTNDSRQYYGRITRYYRFEYSHLVHSTRKQ